MNIKGQGLSLTSLQGHSDSTFSNFFSSKNTRSNFICQISYWASIGYCGEKLLKCPWSHDQDGFKDNIWWKPSNFSFFGTKRPMTLKHDIHHQGVLTRSMISLRSVKMTSCLQVNSKQKAKCPFCKGYCWKKTSVNISFLVQSYSLEVHVCRHCFQTLLLLLSGIMSMKREVCTKVEFVTLSHEHICKNSYINSVGIPISSKVLLFASCSYSRKIKV